MLKLGNLGLGTFVWIVELRVADRVGVVVGIGVGNVVGVVVGVGEPWGWWLS